MTSSAATMTGLRLRSTWILCATFALVVLIFSAVPVKNGFLRSFANKDYHTWYKAGQQVINGGPLYEDASGRLVFDFLYPPFAAVGLFALPSLSGAGGLTVFLLVLTTVSWLATIFIGIWLMTGQWSHPDTRLYLLPSLIVAPYAWDIYFLGQPNLLLLGLLMVAFLALRKGLPWLSGLAVATAAAIKAFPILMVGYFLWRRNWAAAGWTVLFTVVLLWGVCGAVRGFDRNQHEIATWVDGMLLKQSDTNIAQRPDLAFTWRNQSLVSTVHRLTRHVPVDVRPGGEKVYVNLIDLGPKGSSIAFYSLFGVLGAVFAFATWKRKTRTRQSDATEYALALGLVLFATPKAGTYYYVWMLFPLTVACSLIYSSALAPARRTAALWLTGASVVIMASAITQSWGSTMTQALGATAWGAVALWCTLMWMYFTLDDRETS